MGNLANTDVQIIVSGNFGVIWRTCVKATPVLQQNLLWTAN